MVETKRITCAKCGNKFWQTADEDGTFDAVCSECAKGKKKKIVNKFEK